MNSFCKDSKNLSKTLIILGLFCVFLGQMLVNPKSFRIFVADIIIN